MGDSSPCENNVQCPYCEGEFHVCDVFPPPEDEDTVMGGEASVRCGKCYRNFTLAEEIVIAYSAYPDQHNYEN